MGINRSVVMIAVLGSLAWYGCPQQELVNGTPINTFIFADLNNNGMFDAGTDVRIYDLMFSGGSGDAVFDTGVSKGTYLAPVGQPVGIVIPALSDGSGMNVRSLSLHASGNIIIKAPITSAFGMSFNTLGQIFVDSNVQIQTLGGQDGFYGINLNGGIVTMNQGSAIKAPGSRIMISSSVAEGFLTGAELAADAGIYIQGAAIQLSQGTKLVCGANPPKDLVDNWGVVQIQVTNAVDANDISIESTPKPGFDFTKDTWPVSVVSVQNGAFRLSNSMVTGYTVLGYAQSITPNLTGTVFSRAPLVATH